MSALWDPEDSPNANASSTAREALPPVVTAASTTAVEFCGAVAKAWAVLKTNLLSTVGLDTASHRRHVLGARSGRMKFLNLVPALLRDWLWKAQSTSLQAHLAH